EELLHVLDGVALRELIGLADDLAFLVDDHRLGRGRAAVEADDPAHHLAGGERRRREPWDAVGVREGGRFARGPDPRRSGVLPQARLAAVLQILDEPIAPEIGAAFLGEPVDARPERGVVLRVLGDEDGLLDGPLPGVRVAALLPDLGDALAPALLQ